MFDSLRNSAERRHQALRELEILDSPSESEFNDLATLAAQICATPISLVSFVDSDRQWFKASLGLVAIETPISSSFCVHAVENEELLVVRDALKDQRFEENPLVLGPPYIRFYAGMPLYAAGGVAVGTLCVADVVPRTLSTRQAKALTILGRQVQARLEMRLERRQHSLAIAENRRLTEELARAVGVSTQNNFA